MNRIQVKKKHKEEKRWREYLMLQEKKEKTDEKSFFKCLISTFVRYSSGHQETS
jgi:hypothetical protein